MRLTKEGVRAPGSAASRHVIRPYVATAGRAAGPRLAVLIVATGLPFIAGTSLAQPQPGRAVAESRLVSVAGQPEPIPSHWLDSAEARITHDLRLPEAVPRPVSFDFDKASWRTWRPNTPKVAAQYFDHLCRTEAGQWIFRTVRDVEGLYFARPQGRPTGDQLTDPDHLEMPWIQRIFMLQGDGSAHHQGTWFIQPPLYNYRFVEQPRREVPWQSGIDTPYIRLFGYTRQAALDQEGKPTIYFKDKTPMQVIGIVKLTARYGYTWRGIRRPRDREHGIAGGEVLVYDLSTHEVLAVRRQFLIASKNPRGAGKAMWEVAAKCPQLKTIDRVGLEFTQFAFDVLHTIEPSTTGRKQ